MSRLENIQNSFKSIQAKTKAFFHGDRWKEVLVFFFFALLAFGFWLLQSLQQEYEIELVFPVKYKNVPVDIAFNVPEVETITAKVKDKGSVLLNYTFGRSFAPIEVNMKNTKEKNGSVQVSKRQIENDIQKQLIATTALQSFDPQQIDMDFSQRVHKEIPVVFNGDIHLEAGFQLSGDIRITPQKINAYATAAILDTLTSVKTAFTEVKKANKNITRTVQLIKVDGVNFDPENVSITIPIEEYTEKTLEIPVSCSHIPPHYTVRMFPAVVKVTCSVPLSRFKGLSEDMFSIHIPFEDLEQNVSGTLPVKLTKKPDWVHTATLLPDKVEFILEHNNKHD